MLVAKKEMRTFNDKEEYYIGNAKQTEKNRKKAKGNVRSKLRLFTFAFVVLLISLSILIRYAQITQVKYNIAKLDSQIFDLNKEKQNISIELEKIKESALVEKKATEELGMRYPTSEQTFFVSLENTTSETVAKTVEMGKNDPVFLKAFGDAFNKIIGFIE